MNEKVYLLSLEGGADVGGGVGLEGGGETWLTAK